MSFKGWTVEQYWDASANKPKLVSGRGENGKGYIVSVAGSTNIDGNNVWSVNDVIIFVLDQWVRVSNGVSPPSVGAVVTGATGMTRAEAIATSFGTNPPETLRTIGRDLPGDLGGGLYKNVVSLPAAPLTNVGTWTSADGWHYLQIPEAGEVWVESFGAKGTTNFNDFSFDNWQAFEDCKYWIISVVGTNYTIRAGGKMFYLSDSFSLEGQTFNFRGSGRPTDNGGGPHFGTIIRTPLKKDGFQTQHVISANQTIGHEGGPFSGFALIVGQLVYWPGGTKVFKCTSPGMPAGTEPAGTGTGIVTGAATVDYVRDLRYSEKRGYPAVNCRISDVLFWGGWDRFAVTPDDDEDQTQVDGGYHSGVVCRARAELDNVSAIGYPGHGIAMIANGDPTIRAGGNCNDWRLNRCTAFYNGHNGIHTGYSDANAGLATDIDTGSNGEWGIRDASFLTNTWVACQSAYDGAFIGGGLARYHGMVNHNGYLWLAMLPNIGGDETRNYHNEPGTDSSSWTRWGGDGTYTPDPFNSPAWDNVTTYRPTGCFSSDNINNRAQWMGPYIEGGTDPAQWCRRTSVWGGIMGGFYDLTRGAMIYEDNIFHNALNTSQDYAGPAGLRILNTSLGGDTLDGPPIGQALLKYQIYGDTVMQLQTANSGGANVTASVADATYGGVTVGVLTVTSVGGGLSGTFAVGGLVNGGGLPFNKVQIARQINPATGATISWTGGAGSYALSLAGHTVASGPLVIDYDGTANLDIVMTQDSQEVWGWTGTHTVKKFGRNAALPYALWNKALLAGDGGGFGNSSPAQILTVHGAPSAGDYAHGTIGINDQATNSGDGSLYQYMKTGTFAGSWKKIASIP